MKHLIIFFAMLFAACFAQAESADEHKRLAKSIALQRLMNQHELKGANLNEAKEALNGFAAKLIEEFTFTFQFRYPKVSDSQVKAVVERNVQIIYVKLEDFINVVLPSALDLQTDAFALHFETEELRQILKQGFDTSDRKYQKFNSEVLLTLDTIPKLAAKQRAQDFISVLRNIYRELATLSSSQSKP